MKAERLKAALADIAADADPTRKVAKMASLFLYPQPYAPARECAMKLAAVALGGAVELDWKEVRRLAGGPEYRILPECEALLREVANELKIESPLDSY